MQSAAQQLRGKLYSFALSQYAGAAAKGRVCHFHPTASRASRLLFPFGFLSPAFERCWHECLPLFQSQTF